MTNFFRNFFFALLLLAGPAGAGASASNRIMPEAMLCARNRAKWSGYLLKRPADAIRQVFLPANDLVYDSATHRIYASVPAGDNSPGSITALDPETGQVGPSVPIDGKPGRLAIADQGRFLYVGLDDAGAVRQFDTVTGTAGLQFSLGSGTGP